MVSVDKNSGTALLAVAVTLLPRILWAQYAGADIALGQDMTGELHADHFVEAQPVNNDPLGDIVVEFDLLDRGGNVVSAEDFQGQYILLGFGFTHCPTVCPMMVLNMGKALREVEVAAMGIFVSVDTERDSPTTTDDYASRFGERMMGLGGSIEQINTAASNFKVSYAVTKTQNNYTVQHTANVYLIDPLGKLVDVFTFSTPADALIQAMQ